MNATYCGPPPLPSQIAASFNLDPILIAALFALGIVLRRKPAGLAAVAVLAIAFISPLCALSSALFAARAAHHVVIIAIAAPLLACALPSQHNRNGGVALPFAISTLVLWGWHVPAAYDMAFTNVAVYWAMQLTLFGSAAVFWRAVFAQERSSIDRLVFIVAGFAQMGMLGAILTFAPKPLYAAHAIAPFTWGLTPLEDQVLGGLVMWVLGGIPYAIVAMLMARRGWTSLTRATA